jgi:hypothetical protein
MASANRRHIPGCIWHITHRCWELKELLRQEGAEHKAHFQFWLGDRRYPCLGTECSGAAIVLSALRSSEFGLNSN